MSLSFYLRVFISSERHSGQCTADNQGGSRPNCKTHPTSIQDGGRPALAERHLGTTQAPDRRSHHQQQHPDQLARRPEERPRL